MPVTGAWFTALPALTITKLLVPLPADQLMFNVLAVAPAAEAAVACVIGGVHGPIGVAAVAVKAAAVK